MNLFFERIDVSQVLKNHFSTFYDNSTQRVAWGELFLMVFFNIVPSGVLCFNNILIAKSGIEELLNVYAVLGGFFITCLFLLMEKVESAQDANKILVRETFYNTAYGVLLCIVLIIVCGLYKLLPDKTWTWHIILSSAAISSFIIYTFTLSFFHTILMIIKRLSTIFRN